tara:strand:+ start:2799 stop:3350 length:552 start_codon:yes stop_codon:yes gene_type:complete
MTGQSWIKTTSHTATISILPVITYVITSIISGNIALSLGMVGALSIVRFRNPVRSPLELTVYFTAITMGITASVSERWLLLLALSIYLITFLLALISFVFKKYFKKQFFLTSFSEGNSLSTLEIITSESFPLLDQNKLLKSISSNKTGEKQYLLVSSNFNYLRNLILQIENDKSIIRYQLNES